MNAAFLVIHNFVWNHPIFAFQWLLQNFLKYISRDEDLSLRLPDSLVRSDYSCLTFLYFRLGNIPGNFILSDHDIKIIVNSYPEGLKIFETIRSN